jgi:hypothetical protein
MIMTTNFTAERNQWATRISTAWQKSVESIIETGGLLIAAKAALDHGQWGQMVESDLPFSRQTAHKLMKIADDARLSNVAHVRHLPPSWGILYELTKLDDDTFDQKLRDGTIRPDMHRKDVARNILSRGRGRRRVEATDIEEAFDGIDPDAHLTETESKTASVLQERLQAPVESEKPPTTTQLAEVRKTNRQRPLRDLGDRSPEEFAAATALAKIIEDFVYESASVDIALALRGCEKAQLELLLAPTREWLKYLLGGGDAPDGLVGCVAEVSKSSDGTGKEAEPAPTLDPRAWSISTAEQRQAFVKAVGRSAIEIALHAIDPSYASTRESPAFFAVNVRHF